MAFKHKLKAKVQLTESGEIGTVVRRLDSIDSRPQYAVRYKAADGRQTEAWWDDSAVEAVPVE